jgi:hypothetical protein
MNVVREVHFNLDVTLQFNIGILILRKSPNQNKLNVDLWMNSLYICMKVYLYTNILYIEIEMG